MDNPDPLDGVPAADPDAHGRAALLLVESLIHGLTARGVLTVAEAVAIMELALDTQTAIVDETAAPSPSMRKATTLLTSLVQSMRVDLPRES